jgi:hypothetical protein
MCISYGAGVQKKQMLGDDDDGVVLLSLAHPSVNIGFIRTELNPRAVRIPCIPCSFIYSDPCVGWTMLWSAMIRNVGHGQCAAGATHTCRCRDLISCHGSSARPLGKPTI